jgi:ribosome-binding protein aMBF1 (putative translation factor)
MTSARFSGLSQYNARFGHCKQHEEIDMEKTLLQNSKATAPPQNSTSRKTFSKSQPVVTKRQQIINLMKRQRGASLSDLSTVTGWQIHSLRGFISGTLVKRDGQLVKSGKFKGERRYRIIE